MADAKSDSRSRRSPAAAVTISHLNAWQEERHGEAFLRPLVEFALKELQAEHKCRSADSRDRR